MDALIRYGNVTETRAARIFEFVARHYGLCSGEELCKPIENAAHFDIRAVGIYLLRHYQYLGEGEIAHFVNHNEEAVRHILELTSHNVRCNTRGLGDDVLYLRCELKQQNI